MVERRFSLESWGRTLSITLGGAPRPVDPEANGEAFLLAQGLLSELGRPSVWRVLRHLHVELTGERLPNEFDPFHIDGEIVRDRVEDSLRLGLATGLVALEPVAKPRAFIPLEPDAPVAPEFAPARAPEEEVGTFQACFLDHTGAPIANLDVTLSLFGKQTPGKTDGSGVVKFERFSNGFASLKVKSEKVAEALEPVWAKGLPNVRFDGVFQELRFRDELPDIQLELGVERIVVVRPEMGKLDLRLRDKSGRVSHAFSKYEISGPVKFDGETNESGRLFHEDVPPGNYGLKFTQTFDEELKLESVDHETQLIVLGGGQSAAQERWLGAVPQVRMARLRGMVFDTNKCFLLPTAIPALSKIRDEYERNNPAHLLIVGHTDTSGEDGYNVTLSEERAEAVKQYLEDDVDAWLENYDRSDAKKKWGAREDRLMMTQLDGFLARAPEEPPVLWYQKHHNARADAKGRPKLEEDGIAGPKTREELVRDYMALDGVTLSEEAGFLITVETHGCGENFPLDATGNELDQRIVAERNDERDQVDRRVELFFFDEEYGVLPKKTGPKGEEYLVWRERAETFQDEAAADIRQKATVIRLGDGHFQTGSAVLLPESAAGGGKGAPLALAMALRFAEERPGQSLLLGGHADSVGADKSNDQLSEKRGELTHALLMGNRDKFAELAQETGKVSDWKTILEWASTHLAGLEPADSDAPPPANDFSEIVVGKIDENATTGVEPLKSFQRAYNANKASLGASGDDLKVDGSMGKKSWGAVFDCYQFVMASELGEVEDGADENDPVKKLEGMGKLRDTVTFLPTQKPFLGFGEKVPVNGVGKDDVASAPNRRVELMFFEQGQEPDVAILDEAPDVSELHLPDAFEKNEIEGNSAKEGAFSPPFRIFLRKPRSSSADVAVLTSTTGKFPATAPVRTESPDSIVVEFANVPRRRRYTLQYASAATNSTTLFSDAVLEDVEFAERALPPEAWSEPLDALPAPTNEASDDELVRFSDVDRPPTAEEEA